MTWRDWCGREEFFRTARERHLIWQRRENGEPAPWTDDPILRAWRFCCVHREHDRTTRWFAENVRSKLQGLHAVQATTIFRWFNRIETGERILDLLLGHWDSREALERLRGITPVVTGAYIVRTPFGSPKLEGLLESIDHMVEATSGWSERVAGWTTLQAAWEALTSIPYMGSFTSYEVVCDLRWTPVLSAATDVMTWASAGPGCARGLGWVMGGEPTLYNYSSARDQAEMRRIMEVLLDRSEVEFPYQPRWEMREVEHWACEFDKYMRARRGQRLKRRYP
jgi:hypothetical protein